MTSFWVLFFFLPYTAKKDKAAIYFFYLFLIKLFKLHVFCTNDKTCILGKIFVTKMPSPHQQHFLHLPYRTMVHTLTYPYKQTRNIKMKTSITAVWRSHAVELTWSRREIVKQAISCRAVQSLHADTINWLRHLSQDSIFRLNSILYSIWTDPTSQQLQKPREFTFTPVKYLSVFWLFPTLPKASENYQSV